MKIALCDDERILLSALENNIRTILDQRSITYELECFEDGYDLIRHYRDFDVIFMDIDMPIMDGLSTAKLIREKDKCCRVVFLTSFGEFVYKAFEVNAFRCMVKPIDSLELAGILEAVVNDMKTSQKKLISIETQHNKFMQLNMDDILYIETVHRGVRLHTAHQVIESTLLMKDVEAILPHNQFFRTHISFLVNMGQIRESRSTEIVMNNHDIVLLSRLKASKFKSAFIAFIKSGTILP